MEKYTIMIIDDHIERRIDMWMDFLTNRPIDNSTTLSNDEKLSFKKKIGIEFNVIYPQDEVLTEFIKRHSADAYFLDVYLADNEGWNIESALNSIREYNPRVPIFVYSSQWKEKEVVSDVTQAFRQSFIGRTANYFYDTFNINNIVDKFRKVTKINQLGYIKRERKLIIDMIDGAYKKTQKELASCEGDISILHISDIQYGDENMTDYQETIWSEVKRICQEMKEKDEISGIDLVAITGDISMHGKREEFSIAKENMDKYLFEKLWPDEVENRAYRERILIVPGNHDFDLNFCTLDYLNSVNCSEKGSRKIDFNKASNMLLEENRKKQNDYHDMGFSAFANYAYSVTGNEHYIKYNHYNFVVNTFTNWGLKIVCINSCDGINAEKTNGVDINGNELREILNSYEQKDYNYITLILSHHTPKILDDMSEDEKNKFKVKITQLINTTRATLWLGGHRHISDVDEQPSAFGSIKIYEAPTISLKEDWKKELKETVLEGGEKTHTYRGFQIIKLKRERDRQDSIKKIVFMFNEEGTAKRVVE